MIQVLVGATVPERDITEDIVGLAYSSAAPGGFASCSFTLPGRAMFRYVNQLRHDARVWVRRGTKTLWEGYVVNDPEAVKFGDDADVEVECAGLLERAKRRRDYAKTWVDLDYGQWVATNPDSQFYTGDNDGHLYILCTDGTTVPAGVGYSFYYWIDSGMGDDDIDHCIISASWDIGTGFDGVMMTSPSPWDAGGWTNSDLQLSAESSPLAAYRDPESGSYPAGTKAVRLKFYNPAGSAATADRSVTGYVAVYSAAYPAAAELADYMLDAANDVATTTSDTTGSATVYTGTAAIRPFATRAEALDYLASLHSAPLDWGFWDDDSFAVAERAAAPAMVDHLIVDASDEGVTWGVERIAEDACDAVCVMYGVTGHATHPDGTVLTTYRASDPASAEARVHVLDYSEQYMSATEAAAVGDQYLDYMGTTQYEGTVTIVGRCKRVDGATVLASDMRAGMWVENLDEYGHAPRYVSHCDYDAESDTATLSVGDPRKEFASTQRVSPATGVSYFKTGTKYNI